MPIWLAESRKGPISVFYWPQLWVIDFWLLRTFSQIIAGYCPRLPDVPTLAAEPLRAGPARKSLVGGEWLPPGPGSHAQPCLSRALARPEIRCLAVAYGSRVPQSRPRRQPRRTVALAIARVSIGNSIPARHLIPRKLPAARAGSSSRADIWRSPPLLACSAAQAWRRWRRILHPLMLK